MAKRSPGMMLAVLSFLSEHRGGRFCAECIAAKLFDGRPIDNALRQIEGMGVTRQHGTCSACSRQRLVSGLRP